MPIDPQWDGIEQQRRQTILDYQLESLATEPELDHMAEFVADLFSVPISAVSVLGIDLQMFHGSCGLDQPTTARADAFCNVTVEGDSVFIVEDALADPRFRQNPLVTGEPHIRFYAGAPLRIGQGVPVGSLCIIDRVPRSLNDQERRRLALLARTVTDLLELRVGSRRADQQRRALAEQTDLLRATVDSVQQGIAVFDKQLKVLLWNNQLVGMLGLPAGFMQEGLAAVDIVGAVADRFSLGSVRPEQVVADLISSAANRSNYQRTFIEHDDRTLQAWFAGVPDGRFIMTVEDVTERSKVTRMKDEFVSTVSHELRTPLTSIRGALAILERKALSALDEQSAQLLQMANRNAERLTVLINDILDMEKLGSGALSVKEQSLDLVPLVREACEQNRPFAIQHCNVLEVHIESPHVRVIGDPVRLTQALTNLISNACKFSPKDTAVIVSLRRRDRWAELAVRDFGSGVPSEFASQLFRRFAQADPGHLETGSPGTGLGLAITKTIVERLGGSIAFENPAGGGALFCIRLPIEEGS